MLYIYFVCYLYLFYIIIIGRLNGTRLCFINIYDTILKINYIKFMSISNFEHEIRNSSGTNVPQDSQAELLNSVEQSVLSNIGNNVLSNLTKKPENLKSNFIKEAPLFYKQVQDESRTSLISYVPSDHALGFNTNKQGLEITEHQSLINLYDFLKTHSQKSDNDNFTAKHSTSILENLSYIGQKEYYEATQYIAEAWKQRLDSHEIQQLCVITGKINPLIIKSDEYLLDNVLKNFNQQDVKKYRGRLLFDPQKITSDPKKVDIVMLDDWIISGRQIKDVSGEFLFRHPEYIDRTKIQLIISPEKYLLNGLELEISDPRLVNNMDRLVLPVASYYKAHPALKEYAPYSQAHITGSHCSVDYDFNNTLSLIINQINGSIMHQRVTQSGDSNNMAIDWVPFKKMPSGSTNIRRPYRKDNYQPEQTKKFSSKFSIPYRLLQKINTI